MLHTWAGMSGERPFAGVTWKSSQTCRRVKAVRHLSALDRPIYRQLAVAVATATMVVAKRAAHCICQMLRHGLPSPSSPRAFGFLSYRHLQPPARTHLALEKDAPLGRAIRRCGTIIATIPILLPN